MTFLHVATGWVLCRSRPAVTSLVLTVGSRLPGHAAKHWSSYERFFSRASWSLGDVSRLLLAQVALPLVDGFGVPGAVGEGVGPPGLPPVDLGIDDTTCGRHGRHVAWAGYFKDASASNVAKAVIHWSHNWVPGCVALRCRRWPDWVIGSVSPFQDPSQSGSGGGLRGSCGGRSVNWRSNPCFS